ncbi:MAG: repeat-like protein [Planctomycetaceae bacterium]|nr:repeat-like protein [Planctomycetaceae bacterium]
MSAPTLQVEAPAALPIASTNTSRLRLWPGVVIVVLLWTIRTLATMGSGSPMQFMGGLVLNPMIALLLLNVWWLFGSRLKWSDRLLVLGTFVAVTVATILFKDVEFPVMALILYAAPAVVTGWVGWLVLTQKLQWPIRRAGLLLILIATGVCFTLIRSNGWDGSFNPEITWRWTPTAEQKHLAELEVRSAGEKKSAQAESKSAKAKELTSQPGDWVEFRGPQRDSRLTGVRIRTDWDKNPPKELWRHRIGPGWSSFAVVRDRLFTQEQRGEKEFVVCYDAQTGNEIWSHHDATRFSEPIAGPGPRSTPTFHSGKILALGANGQLNCLDAATGTPVWSRNIVDDSGAQVPMWGFSSSPLVVQNLVTVFAGGPEQKSVLAYRVDSGELAWSAGEGSLSYCSTQLSKIDGVEQLLITTDVGLFSLQPATGKVLWQHAWPSEGVARVVQPAVISQSDILIGTGMGIGTRRISVKHSQDQWESTELWTNRSFKPYYNDFIVSGDYLYGFDGNIFLCASLSDGSIKWRARGYGNGQVLFLADQQVLLVLTETGEVALIEAKPEKHQEISRFKAIEGKTWNHPVVAHGKLFVRNAEETACFELKLDAAPTKVAAKIEQ